MNKIIDIYTLMINESMIDGNDDNNGQYETIIVNNNNNNQNDKIMMIVHASHILFSFIKIILKSHYE